jgi:hypothetical protein
MKLNGQFPTMLFLAGSCLIATACTSSTPTNSNQPGASSSSTQANAAQGNSSAAKSSQPPNQSTTGSIEVNSVPPGAKVLLVSTEGGIAGEPQPKGLTPTTITGLEPGKYTVDLEKPGYKFFQKEVVVKEGTTTKVSASLKKQ